MAANTPMGRLDSVEQSAIEGLLGLDASKLSALAGKKAELLALVEPDEPVVGDGGE